MIVNKGKTVYWIDGKSFESDKGTRNGKLKANQYCLDNFKNPNEIRKFDSRTERDRFEYLLQLEKNGVISNLSDHFKIKIQDEFVNSNGDLIPALTYEADFIYFDEINKIRVVEDVKGSEYFLDERFITIKQVFDFLKKDKGLYIKVILYRNKEWVEWHIGEKKKTQTLIKKQRAKIKALEVEKKEKLKEERKLERLKARRERFLEKGRLTPKEAKTLVAVENELAKSGLLFKGEKHEN